MDGTSSEETLKNDALNKIREKNSGRIIIDYLNINSLRNKFEMLKEVIRNKIDILLISETKLDDAFLLSQFNLEGFIYLFISTLFTKVGNHHLKIYN